jgi:uncharacterized iron-regulated membrane protein
MHAHVLKSFRQVHLYLGVFTAPAILFFAISGALQTFSLHEASRDGSYKPARWIVLLAQIHKKQTPIMPQHKSLTSPAGPAETSAKLKAQNALPSGGETRHNSLPLKIFFLIVSLGLCMSTISGLYMSWKYRRSRILLSLVFISGIIIPVVAMAI